MKTTLDLEQAMLSPSTVFKAPDEVLTAPGLSDEERRKILGQAAAAFRGALELDETNADAKTNLEAVLSTFGPVALPANAPSQGRDNGNVSGLGSPGSGY